MATCDSIARACQLELKFGRIPAVEVQAMGSPSSAKNKFPLFLSDKLRHSLLFARVTIHRAKEIV